MSEMLAARLAYAASGLWTFPVPPGTRKSYKSSKFSGGVNWGATCDPNVIRYDYSRWPHANVGICTGPQSNIFVIDVDTLEGHGVDGLATMRALENQHGQLPPTRQAISPSGSIHHYFRWPAGDYRIKNNTSRLLGPGIDVRGQGGMCIAPPSINPDGRPYSWLTTMKVANAPSWLLRLVVERPRQPRPPRVATAANTEPPASASYAVLCLHQIDPDIDYRSWFEIACALLTELGEIRGFEVFNEWSSGGSKYEEHKMLAFWRSLVGKRYPYSVRTIEYYAEQAKPGWWIEVEREIVEGWNQAAANDASGLWFGQKDTAA